jgi:hypothetical protein
MHAFSVLASATKERLGTDIGAKRRARSAQHAGPDATLHGEVMLQGAREILALHSALGEQLGMRPTSAMHILAGHSPVHSACPKGADTLAKLESCISQNFW